MNATSKKTGMDIISPAMRSAIGERLIPKVWIRRLAMSSIPPVCCRTAPKKDPNPTITPTKPKVPPSPFWIELKVDIGSSKPSIPKIRQAIRIDRKA